MLSDEEILEQAARDGSIDMYAPSNPRALVPC